MAVSSGSSTISGIGFTTCNAVNRYVITLTSSSIISAGQPIRYIVSTQFSTVGAQYNTSVQFACGDSDFQIINYIMAPSQTIYSYLPPETTPGTCYLGVESVNYPLAVAYRIITITITSTLSISSPSNGTNFTSGSLIPVLVSATGGSTPQVTVNLTCTEGPVIVTTGTAGTIFNIATTAAQLGDCLISLNPVGAYDLSTPVAVTIYRQLSITTPTSGQSLTATQNTTILVSAPGPSVPTRVRLICPISGIFSWDLQTNVATSVQVPAAAILSCSMTATTTLPYYFNTTTPTQLSVYSPLTLQTPLPASIQGGNNFSVLITPPIPIQFDFTLTTRCPATSYSQTIRTVTPSEYTLPEDLNGISCTFVTENLPGFILGFSYTYTVTPSQQTTEKIIQALSVGSFAGANLAGLGPRFRADNGNGDGQVKSGFASTNRNLKTKRMRTKRRKLKHSMRLKKAPKLVS